MPTQKSVALFPEDELLRDCGFTVLSRPKEGQSVWLREGMEFLFSDALRRAKQQRNKLLLQLEEQFSSNR